MKLHGPAITAPPSRILLVQPRRIGDVLLGTPAIRALATHFPGVPIDFLVERPADETLWGHPHIARLLVAPPPKGLSENLNFVRRLRAERYDWAIDFFSNPRSAQFTWLSGARVRVGLDRRGRRWAYTHRVIEEAIDRDRYQVDWRLEILRQMHVPPAGLDLEIYSDSQAPVETQRAQAALAGLDASKPLVALATGSYNTEKLYPPDLTAQVIAGLLQAGRSWPKRHWRNCPSRFRI
jgi:ADP-heptose:LPS heptosyltransferase